MELAAINTVIGILKSIVTIIKSKGVLYFAGSICFLGLIIIVIAITFLFYAAKGIFIKTKGWISG